MAQTIEIGTLLLEEGTHFPASLSVENDHYLKGWGLVKNLTSSALDRKLGNAGWTFFYMAGELSAAAFGSDSGKTTRRAISRVIAKMKPGRFNCLEISQVAAKSFLGLTYVAVAGHARHIQEGIYIFHAKHITEWAQPKLAVVGTEEY